MRSANSTLFSSHAHFAQNLNVALRDIGNEPNDDAGSAPARDLLFLCFTFAETALTEIKTIRSVPCDLLKHHKARSSAAV
jgi:hypothetical protein